MSGSTKATICFNCTKEKNCQKSKASSIVYSCADFKSYASQFLKDIPVQEVPKC